MTTADLYGLYDISLLLVADGIQGKVGLNLTINLVFTDTENQPGAQNFFDGKIVSHDPGPQGFMFFRG